MGIQIVAVRFCFSSCINDQTSSVVKKWSVVNVKDVVHGTCLKCFCRKFLCILSYGCGMFKVFPSVK